MPKSKLLVGDIVTCCLGARYAVVRDFLDLGYRHLAVLHYIDADTGLPMECPDRARCQHRHTCPIHGCNVDAHNLDAFPVRDLEFYQQEGMLSAELVAVAKANHGKRPKAWSGAEFAEFLNNLLD